MKKIYFLLIIIFLGIGALIVVYSIVYGPKEPGEGYIGNELEKTDLIKNFEKRQSFRIAGT